MGISAFTTSTPGMECVFRERYGDFVVHEIGLDGAVAELTEEAAPAESEAPPMDSEEAIAEVVSLVGEEGVALKLRRLLADTSAPPVVLPGTDDKDCRTRLHKAVARVLPALASDTVEVEGVKSVRILREQPGAKRKRRPSGRPRHVRLALYKENAETMAAVSRLSRATRSKVGYAGTKDRRAVTTQWVTVSNISPSDIIQRAKSVRCRVGNCEYVDAPLDLGDLAGNRFEIALRRVEATPEGVDAACSAVGESGFVNYFGLQRFGSGASNADVGVAVIARDWTRCLSLILAPKPWDDPPASRAKRAYELGDLDAARAAMPKHQRSECAILNALRSAPNDHYRAFHKAVPKHLRLMYLHAHQSLVFNALATARVDRHGASAVVDGDLVVAGGSQRSADLAANTAQVVVAKAGDGYSIFDVVLPLVGHSVVVPTFDGASGAVASSGALENDDYARAGLTGAYRRLFVRPTNFSWRLVPYRGARDQLVETDLDRLDKKKQLECPPPETVQSDANFTALIVSFDLPPSSYATCCLREITKSSMSKGLHAARTRALADDEVPDVVDDDVHGEEAAAPLSP